MNRENDQQANGRAWEKEEVCVRVAYYTLILPGCHAWQTEGYMPLAPSLIRVPHGPRFQYIGQSRRAGPLTDWQRRPFFVDTDLRLSGFWISKYLLSNSLPKALCWATERDPKLTQILPLSGEINILVSHDSYQMPV